MKKGRRKKIRYIQKMPNIMQFSPRGKPGRPDEIELKIDEYEAFKLADFQGYDQKEGGGLGADRGGRAQRQRADHPFFFRFWAGDHARGREKAHGEQQKERALQKARRDRN